MRTISRNAGTTMRATAAGRVLIVANRLPYTAARQGQTFRLERSSGGLSTGLWPVREQRPSLWIGWAGTNEPAEPLQGLRARLSGLGCKPVPLDQAEVAGFYERFSNSVLWPLLHGWSFSSDGATQDWDLYCRINERFADAVASEVRAGDCVWVHDYHLMLVPRLLRQRGCRAPVGFFLHTPFPDPATFGALPEHEELLAGLLGADLIGFHTIRYAQSFLAAVAGTLPHHVRGGRIYTGDRCARVCADPMGIDFDAFNGPAAGGEIRAEVAAMRGSARTTMLLGVDRLDYTKGVLQRLLAFEQLLLQHPRYLGQVRLVQIAVPTRAGVRAYQELREIVESTVKRINERFGGPDWTPIEYQYGSVSRDKLIALYRAADVMLVTPLRDGLNLVSKEFVASRPDEDGVLILSRYAGAAAELTDALLVTPQNIDELAAACYAALIMAPAERRRRMRNLRRSVASNEIFGWVDRMILRIQHAGRERAWYAARHRFLAGLGPLQ
jgi:trehalose 6-phosphate synthase/phosphatase